MQWIQISEDNQPEEKLPTLVRIIDKKEQNFFVTTAHRKKKSFYVWNLDTEKFSKLKKKLKVTHWAVGIEMPR